MKQYIRLFLTLSVIFSMLTSVGFATSIDTPENATMGG